MYENIILIAVILLIVCLAARYVIKAKKSGVKCIGCSAGSCCCQQGEHTKSCGGNEQSVCSCGHNHGK